MLMNCNIAIITFFSRIWLAGPNALKVIIDTLNVWFYKWSLCTASTWNSYIILRKKFVLCVPKRHSDSNHVLLQRGCAYRLLDVNGSKILQILKIAANPCKYCQPVDLCPTFTTLLLLPKPTFHRLISSLWWHADSIAFSLLVRGVRSHE